MKIMICNLKMKKNKLTQKITKNLINYNKKIMKTYHLSKSHLKIKIAIL
jgi:hypothetical protein